MSLLAIQEPKKKILHLKGNPLMFKTLEFLKQKIEQCDELILTNCHSLSSASLIQLLEGCNLANISKISFDCCSGLDDTVLTSLSQASSLQNLKTLSLVRCRWFTNEGIKKILDSPVARTIKELNLSRCECITDATLKILAESPTLKCLEALDLTKCYDITSQGLKNLLNSENISQLKKLHLTECWQIRDEGLAEISNSLYLKNIEELYLDGLTYITNTGVRSVAFTSNVDNLRVLSVANCFMLDDMALRTISGAHNLKNLQELNLNHNSKMTSTGIEDLFKSPHFLSLQGLHIKDIYLSLRGDKAMTDSPYQLRQIDMNTKELNHFMASENADGLQEMRFGESNKFSRNMSSFEENLKGSKRIILEKEFPYPYNLPLFRNINILCISLPNLSDETLDLILENSHLSSLKVIRFINLQRISEFGMKKFLSSKELLGSVRVLELRHIRNLSNQCVKVLSKNKAVKLLELRIEGGHEFIEDVRLDTSGLSSLILSPVCTHLKILELVNLRLEEDILKYVAISDDMQNLEELILDKNFPTLSLTSEKDQQQALKIFFSDQSKLKALKILSLKDCPALTSKAFQEFYNAHKGPLSLPALETIDLDFTDEVQSSLLRQISKNAQSLAFNSELVMKNLKNKEKQANFEELFKFRYSNSQLLKIELSNVDLLMDRHLATLADLNSIKLLRTLKLVDLPNVNGSFFKEWAKSETINNFTHLQKIHLINLSNLESEGLESFITEANLEALIKLEIRSCPLLGNEFLKALAASKTIKRLHLLVLSSLRSVTDTGLSFIVNSQVANKLRVLELKDIRSLHAETLEAISKSRNLGMLLSLHIIDCPQIDSSKITTIFDSITLPSLANLTFDNPIVPNDFFLKSFVFTKLTSLVHFSLKFAGDFPRDGLLELLRKPEVHLKHIVLAELVGNNLETIANDGLIELLVQSDFIDICLSLNVNGNAEIRPISANRLLDCAANPGFDLEKFLNHYGSLIDDKLLLQMGHWELGQEDYMRRKILVNRGLSDESPSKRKSELSSPTRAESRQHPVTPSAFRFRIHGLDDLPGENIPNNEAGDGRKFINFLESLPLNYNFKSLPKVTSGGIANIIKYLSPEFDALQFMKTHQEILDEKILAELIKTKSFQEIKWLSLEDFKQLTKESYRLLFSSENKFFYAKMFDLAKSLKCKFDLQLLTSMAKSKEFLQVEVIKAGKSTLELQCFDGLKELFQSQFNEKVRKIEFLDVYATHESFELLKETSTLKNLEKITVKYAANDDYVYGLKNFISSRKFSQLKNIHFHKCVLPAHLMESLEASHYVKELSEIHLSKCHDEGFLIPFSKTRNLKKITNLKLKKMFVPSEFFDNLKSSNLSIEQLVLDQIKLATGSVDILLLVSQMKSSKIKKLSIDSLKISSTAIDSMENNMTFSNIEYLSFSDNSAKSLTKRSNQAMVSIGNAKTSRASYAKPSRTLTKKMTTYDDLSLADFEKMMKSNFVKSLKDLKVLYQFVDDEWIYAMLESEKLENLNSLEFHPDCYVTAAGLASIFGSRKRVFKKLNLSLFLQRNSQLIDDGLILFLSHQRKLHYLNGLSIETEKVTSEGIISLLKNLDLKKNSKFKLPQFLTLFKDKVNDEVIEALSDPKFASDLQSEDLTMFKNVQVKSQYKLKVLMMKNDDQINQLLRDAPHIVDDEFIQTICKSSVLNQPENHGLKKKGNTKLDASADTQQSYRNQSENQDSKKAVSIKLDANPDSQATSKHQSENQDNKKIVNIKLDSNLHTQVTSKGLNALILQMCKNSFTVYHDWILLEDHWRNLLRPETIKLLANDEVCQADSLDLVNELDFENNFYVSTNGYQHLLRKEIKNFQKEQDLEHQDEYLLEDTNDFLTRLNNNRFEKDRMKIDDENGELFLKIIAKCKHLKKINFKNKNLGDKFFRSFSILLSQNSLHFLEELNFGDNPRITSTGFKYLYTAIVGNDSIKRIYLKCDEDITSDITTIVDDGLYIWTKKRLIAFINSDHKRIDKWFFIIYAYMIIAFPLALWQIYEDRIVQSKRFNQIKNAIKVLEAPFLKPKKKHNASILPFSEAMAPYYNERIRAKAEIMMKNKYETSEVPTENFYFTKNVIKLNEALQNNQFIFWAYVLNFFIYYAVCISIPLIFNGEGCQSGTLTVGFVIYGIYALAIFIFEVFFYNFMVQTLDDRRALRFGIFQFGHLLTSQTAKFDLFTDVVFIANNYACRDMGLAIASTIIVILSILFNVTYTIWTAKSIWSGKSTHFSSYINRYAKLSLSLELHTIGTALDKFSTSNCVRMGNVYVPQIMVSAISKFVLEDFPQFILQMIKIFLYSRNNANFQITLASTILSLILSFRTAMVARPSVCKAKQVESLIKSDGRRIGQTNLLEVDDKLKNTNSSDFEKRKPPSKSPSHEDEDNLLAGQQSSPLAKNQPAQEDATATAVKSYDMSSSSESDETLR